MGQIKTFKDIKVWEKSHKLVLLVYRLTKVFPKEEIYGLTSQIRRAAVSIPANIAEGFKRNSVHDSLRFYNMSAASLEELKYHLFLSRDLCYIPQQEYVEVENLSEEVSKMLSGWIESQSRVLIKADQLIS